MSAHPIDPEAGDLRGHAARGVVWTAASNWGNEITRLLLFIVLARLLTPAEFGVVALALVFIALTQVIADQGLADALVQRRDLDPEHLDSAFWMSLAVGVVLGAVLAGLAVPLALLLGQGDLAPILAALAIAIPVASLSLVQRAILTRRMAFRSLAMRTLISVVAGAAVGVALALGGFGAWALVGQHIASPLVALAVLWRVSDWRPRLRFSRRHFHDLFGFGTKVVASRLLTVFSRRSDELIIGGFLGAASLGLYTVGYRMLRLLLQVTSSLVDRVAFPVYSRVQDEPERLARAFYKANAFAALVAFPAFMATVVLAPEFLVVLFGDQWLDAAPVMQVLAVLGVLQLLSHLNSTLIKAAGRPGWQLRIIAVTSVLKVAAFLAVVSQGLVAVGLAAVGVALAVAPAWYRATSRLAPITVAGYLAHLRGPLLACAATAGAMLAVRHASADAHAAVTLVAALAAGAVVYPAALWFTARPLTREAVSLVRIAVPTPAVPRMRRPANAETQGG